MSEILESVLRAKAEVDALPKPKFIGAVASHRSVREVEAMLGEAKDPMFAGIGGFKIIPLIGMPDGEFVMFPNEESLRWFLDAVDTWVHLGIEPIRAVQVVRSIIQAKLEVPNHDHS